MSAAFHYSANRSRRMTRHASRCAAILAGAAVCLGASLGACAGGSPGAPDAARAPAPRPAAAGAAPDSCIAGRGSSDTAPPTAPATLAVVGVIRADNVILPRDDAELVAFRQFYRGLVRVDCAGEPRPDLAARWAADSTDRVWTFELNDARFADGSVVTAASVVASWQRTRAAAGLSESLAVAAPDAQHVVVIFFRPAPDAPLRLADPALAVGGGGTLPLATGDFAPDPVAGFGLAVPRGDSGARDPMRIVASAADPRDLLDHGADLLVTRDPAAAAYAAARPDLEVRALPWDRSYALVLPGLVTDSAVDAAALIGVAARDSLAREAVRADARAAAPPFWWTGPSACHPMSSMIGRRRARILFDRADPTARDLAERLVALAGAGRALPAAIRGALAPPLVVAGVSRTEFATAIAAGADAGYVASLPRIERLSCADVPPWPAGATAVALVETRAHLIRRRGAPPALIEGDGAVRVLRPEHAP